jgi:hypothetical protein
MTSSEEAVLFFESYVAAFERFAADEVAEHFTFPLLVTGEGDTVDVRCVADAEEWNGTISLLFDLYRGFGVRTAKPMEMTTVDISPNVMQVAVHWLLLSTEDEEIYRFDGVYTLIRTADTWRVTAIAHNELPRITERLAAG